MPPSPLGGLRGPGPAVAGRLRSHRPPDPSRFLLNHLKTSRRHKGPFPLNPSSKPSPCETPVRRTITTCGVRAVISQHHSGCRSWPDVLSVRQTSSRAAVSFSAPQTPAKPPERGVCRVFLSRRSRQPLAHHFVSPGLDISEDGFTV